MINNKSHTEKSNSIYQNSNYFNLSNYINSNSKGTKMLENKDYEKDVNNVCFNIDTGSKNDSENDSENDSIYYNDKKSWSYNINKNASRYSTDKISVDKIGLDQLKTFTMHKPKNSFKTRQQQIDGNAKHSFKLSLNNKDNDCSTQATGFKPSGFDASKKVGSLFPFSVYFI